MLRSLKDYPEEYRRVYASYEKLSNKPNLVKEFIDEDLMQMLTQSQFNIPPNLPLRLLSIGSGSGVKDLHLLHKLRQLCPQNPLQVTVIEPCKDYIQEYKKLVECDELLKGWISFDWFCQTSQEYQEAQSNDQKKKEEEDLFHFILMFEVLYYEDNLSGALSFYLNILDVEKGFLIAALNVRDTSWSRLFREFSFFEEGASPIGVEDVEEELTNLPCQFERFVKRNLFELDFVFEEGNEEGDNVISLMSHVVNFRAEASEEQVKFYESLMKKYCRIENDHFYFETDIGILVIRKTKSN